MGMKHNNWLLDKKKRLFGGLKKTCLLGSMILGIMMMASSLDCYAAQADIQAKIIKLQIKFPGGKYWNHVGSATDNVNGWTDKACTCHGVSGVSHVYGTGGCTCNHYYDAVQSKHNQSTQCMGFANKLGYDVFGATTWTLYSAPNMTQLANIRIGDIVRYSAPDAPEHSVFVIAKDGYKIKVGEANYGGKCKIVWGREIDLSSPTVRVINYEHANNYDTIVGTDLTEPGTGGVVTAPATTESPTTETPATEAPTTQAPVPYTGWQKAADGVHYQYLEKGKILKKKWITISKKKYYLDKNGYRVTGLVKIGSKHYYFNTKGVMQKKKWVSSNGEDYYVASDGAVLKSQWLYKNNVLVYVTGDGSVAKSELVKIGRNTYYFNSKGKRSKGFKKCNGKYYYCNSKGIIQKKKWITKNGKTYYVQSGGVRAQNKLVKIGKYKYYFNSNGYLLKKQNITYNGKIYRADKKGRCKQIGKVAATETANP